jgi:hypothetical protein
MPKQKRRNKWYVKRSQKSIIAHTSVMLFSFPKPVTFLYFTRLTLALPLNYYFLNIIFPAIMHLIRSFVRALCVCVVSSVTLSCLSLSSISAQTQPTTTLPAPIKITTAMFGDIKARQIGPAAMSGRISAIDVIDKKLDEKNPKSPDQRIIWVGTATGGAWKSLDNGTTFKPVFDKHTQSIGALAIDQSSKGETVWIGTGETNVRNSVSVGDGVYKTTDGGDNWQRMGLEKVERIAKIAIHSTNANIVYVAGLGALWSDSDDRGLYKTIDGGKTWEKILAGDAKTGCADVVLDPSNPNIVYASMWTFRRKGWDFSSGGDGSGFFKSVDGGKTWKKLGAENGLPTGMIGRTCIAVAPSNNNVVYAMVESKKTGIYRSENKGETWKLMADKVSLTLRPFYFAVLTVDPTDENRVTSQTFNSTSATTAARPLKPLVTTPIPTTTHCGLTRKTQCTCFSVPTAVSIVRLTVAENGSSSAICLFRSSTTSATTWKRRTTLWAACKTTAHGWLLRVLPEHLRIRYGAVSALATASMSSATRPIKTISTSSRKAAI